MPKKLIFDDEQLARVVAESTSFWMVAKRIRPATPRGSYKPIQNRIRELALDTSHFTARSPRPVRWTDDDLREAVATSTTVAQVLRKIGLVPAGGNYDQVQRRISKLGLDTKHFLGSGWNLGGKFIPTPARPIEEVLVANQWTSSHHLKTRLFKLGLKKPQCELCGWAERAPDGRIPVELDHKNGDRFDNRLENLRILCPNCHSLQPTHRGLNQRKANGTFRASDGGEGRMHRWCPVLGQLFVALVGFEPTL